MRNKHRTTLVQVDLKKVIPAKQLNRKAKKGKQERIQDLQCTKLCEDLNNRRTKTNQEDPTGKRGSPAKHAKYSRIHDIHIAPNLLRRLKVSFTFPLGSRGISAFQNKKLYQCEQDLQSKRPCNCSKVGGVWWLGEDCAREIWVSGHRVFDGGARQVYEQDYLSTPKIESSQILVRSLLASG